MTPGYEYARTLSQLVRLLQLPSSTADEVRETLRQLVAQARSQSLTLRLDGLTLAVDGAALPPGIGGLDELTRQLGVHHVHHVALRQHATAPELLKWARLLTEEPSFDHAEFEARVAQLRLWHVSMNASDVPDGAEPEEPAPLFAEQAIIAEDLAHIRAGGEPEDLLRTLGDLVALAEECGRASLAEPLADVLAGLGRLEHELEDARVRGACGKALERLATPAVTRLAAQRLPMLAARPSAYRALLEAIGRSGNVGVAALIAHLMAAETMDERRVFFDAIVQLDMGVPLLIDALGHPQWFVVRNAACLLGEMEATRADRALVRLLEHPDPRVREAAAGALARLQTPTARLSLQRMLQDSSPAVRQHAAAAFGGEARIARPLAAALDLEQDADVQLSILAALGRLGTPDAVQKLVRAALSSALRPKPASYRIAALEALAAARGAAALPTLRGLLADREASVRECAERLIATTAMSA